MKCRYSVGYTPLHVAVLHTDTETMHYLCQEGANVTLTNNAGETVFHMCAKNTRYSLEDMGK